MTPIHANRISSKIVAELASLCARIEVAGSIRRMRPSPNDIDLVVMPKPGQEAVIRARMFERTTPITDGPKNLSCRMKDGTQVDVFFAHGTKSDLFSVEPTNWGSVLLCRTGSKEHNIHIAKAAQSLGYKWETMRGIVDEGGGVIASATEEDIFKALKMEFIHPEDREVK